MIEKMTKYSFVLLHGGVDDFLVSLKEIGVMDIVRSPKPVDEVSAGMLADINSLKRQIERISNDDYSRDEEFNSLSSILAGEKRELQLRHPWGEFSSEDIKRLESIGLTLSYYRIASKRFDTSFTEKYPIEVISEDNKYTYFVTVSDSGKVSVPGSEECSAPQGSASETIRSIAKIQSELDARIKVLSKEKENIPLLESKLADLESSLQIYLARCTAQPAAEDVIETFVGFAPTSADGKVQDALDRMDVFYFNEPAKAEDNPPIKLKNNWFARNFETLTGMYGMPVYDEFDPTPILAPFFLLFWAFCMGDAGYGLALIGVGFLLKKVDILGLKEHWRLVVTLGVGATVIGFFLGTFMGIPLAEVSWIPQNVRSLMLAGKLEFGSSSYDVAMVAALAVGVFHICLAMVIKAIGLTGRFGFKESISTWGWIVLIVGGLLVAAGALSSILDATVTKIAVIVIGIVSFLGIFVFNKPGRNPLLNIGAGLWDTYGMVTGLMGDVLSYIRLYALGLAGGMLGGAFNDLAVMTLGDNPTWHWIPFLLIALLGHTLNFAMSCLGAFVHPLRLTFVEYFKNSGYEGKGTEYNPLG